ncbi:23S rRNA (adenine(1618)-N(6))-methyltransferase RlmF [Agarivorans sp. B2Z047]|uniref:23S rRNA (adenine(1618)-N(6))-methyltransferase RlmF n=1 Tax=Agarivorans sp. B2Z047 TaxID=2652721 RepID=UPI00128D11EC|nr:23S rRNA (adenine(1618)-N(6))-methyltransferase RlmF [Agarivorans sp. B2Z047]MPW29914.1 23S rRNA (adenine(1618)-N(6))-methyltransferase RlmF [Agarivorans sp. B2Z047]UQN43481.1 23S rRNA (adenine(1618)-N(6))-methyltransferase RlmF [Agarivorans sp. B2Z047]
MRAKKTTSPGEKSQLHPRNKHRQRYDFPSLIASCPELKRFVAKNQYGDASVDFFDPEAVRCLNKALLKHFYGVQGWAIPKHNLCPPIPGRVDYIHYLADLLANSLGGSLSKNSPVRCIDVGVGANCVYPLVGVSEYAWSFVGSDIEAASLQSAERILVANPHLQANITLRLQDNKKAIFKGIVQANERFELSMCNPPFHRSAADAQKGSQRKQTNLKANAKNKSKLNFGGQSNELWCPGGELSFIKNMVAESQQFSQQVLWFTSLVSKEANLRAIYQALKQAKVSQHKTIKMGQGNKVSRFVAWSYHSPAQQKQWLASL